MSMVVMLAAAFAAIIVFGTAAAAANDAVEHWLAERARRGASGGGGARSAVPLAGGWRPLAGNLVTVRRSGGSRVRGRGNRGIPANASQGGFGAAGRGRSGPR